MVIPLLLVKPGDLLTEVEDLRWPKKRFRECPAWAVKRNRAVPLPFPGI
jgi:hypothetical protein